MQILTSKKQYSCPNYQSLILAIILIGHISSGLSHVPGIACILLLFLLVSGLNAVFRVINTVFHVIEHFVAI